VKPLEPGKTYWPTRDEQWATIPRGATSNTHVEYREVVWDEDPQLPPQVSASGLPGLQGGVVSRDIAQRPEPDLS
jgi:hypothetical protein